MTTSRTFLRYCTGYPQNSGTRLVCDSHSQPGTANLFSVVIDLKKSRASKVGGSMTYDDFPLRNILSGQALGLGHMGRPLRHVIVLLSSPRYLQVLISSSQDPLPAMDYIYLHDRIPPYPGGTVNPVQTELVQWGQQSRH